VQTNAAFQVPYLSVDSYGRVVSATSHSATLVPDVIWWQSVVTCSSWRRLCKVTPDSSYPNFIVSVSAQRDGVTYNNTFAVSVYGKGLANVTKISGSAAQSVSVRVTSAADGTCYFEIFDGNSASTASQTVRCGIVKTSKSTVQTYSTAEDGTTLPDGYSACDALVCSTASIDAKSISADVIYGDAVATTTPASDPSPPTDLSTDQWNQAYEATLLSSGSWNQAYEKTKELNQLSSVAIAFYVEGKVDPVTYNFVVS